MFFAKTVFFFALVLSASALSVPHAARNAHHHRSIAVRAPEPVLESVAVPEPVVAAKPKRKRSLNKRCIANTTSSAVEATSSVVAVTSSAIATSAVATSIPVNVGSTPSVISEVEVTSSVAAATSSVVPTTTEAATSTYVPTTTAAATTTEAESSTYVATSTSSADSSDPTWLTGVNTGDATWFVPGLGACGITNTATDYIVAVSHIIFDAYPGYDGTDPNTNPICNKQITATYEGASVTVTVTDRCVGCDQGSLDFTTTGFSVLADTSVGRLYNMTWEFIDA